MCWYVVQVRVGRELATADLLQRYLDLKVYLPEVKQRWQGKMQLGPLFPGYLFVRDVSGRGALAEVDLTPGCGRLVRCGSHAARTAEQVYVADEVIKQLRDKVLQLNEVGGLAAHHLQLGDSVHINTGPLHGLDAIFLGPLTPSARVQVLLHFLGREQTVTVALDSVEPCAPVLKGERRTRGQRRFIRSTQPAAIATGQ